MTENHVIGFENIDSDMIAKWQGIADLLAKIISVPAALIMKTENEYMEVLVSSKTLNNPYHCGDKQKWHGLYCETVIKTQNELLVSDATADPHWNKTPDIKLGMIAYLGYPINFPDQTPFGTLCVLDNRENTFSPLHKQLLLQLRDAIEMDIAFLKKDVLRNQTERKLEHLNRVLLAIRNVNQLITKEKDHDRLIQGACDNLIETRGYHGAWLALLDERGKPRAAAQAGLGDEFNSLRTMLNDGDTAYCVGLCLENPGVKVISSPRETCGTCPLIEKYNNLSAISVRLEHGRVIYGLLSVSVPFDLAHDESEHSLFQEVADDIAFALHNLEVIKKQKLAEEKLSASEEKYRTLFTTMSQGVVYQDASGAIISANPAAERILGLSIDQMMGRTSMDLRWKAIKEDGSDMPGDTHPTPVALRTGKAVRNMVQGIYHPEKDSYVWILVNAIPLFRPGEKKPYQAYATIEDITVRKQAEDALRKNKKWLDETTRIARVGGWAIDLLGNTLEWTEETFRIHEVPFGAPSDVAKAIEFYHREDRPRVAAEVQRAMESGKDFDFEARIITAKKNPIWVRAIGHGVFCEGRVVGVRGTVQDISDLKKQQEALKQSDERFRKLFEAAPDPYYLNDLKGTFIDGNKRAEELTGYPLEELIGKSFQKLKLLPPTQLPKAVQALAQNAMGKPVGPQEFTLNRKNGERITVEICTYPVTLAGKKVVLGIARDITERKKADNAVRESDVRFHKMLNAVPDMISIHDPAMNIVYSNWNGFAAVDTNKRTLGTKCYATYRGFDGICPDCRAKQVLKTKEPFQEEVKLPDGTFVDLRVFPILDPKGEPYLFVEWVQDITARKRNEEALATEKERLSVTLQSIGDGVITTDTNGKIVLLNNAAEKMTGWVSIEAAGKPLTEVFKIINETTRKECENPVDQVLATGQIVELANHTALVARDNREIIIADSAAPIKNAKGETIGVVLVFRDMTKKKKLETAVEVSSKLESLGVLAGGIAHDFNNLLGGIYGYIDMASISSNDEKVTRYLSKTMATIERARDLTGQLLTFAKGGAPVQKIARLFPFVQETAQFALSGSKVSCDFDIQPDLWNCNYDSNQVGQVIDNLIINAQQAMPVGGTISVSARNIALSEKEHPQLAKGDYVRVSIKDNGVGIPKELLTKIFDPFFTTKTKGHGLGLATCYSIVNRHGGCINVYSEQGKGSVFFVYLPAAKDSVSETEKRKTKQHKGSGTFLVMDDEEVMRETISEMLSALGYTVVCKENGKDAVDYVASELKAGRVLSGMVFDLTVPGGMGGKDAVSEIRKLNNQIPVFVASGYADDPVMKTPEEYGFTASICKPFRRIELIEMLEKHMKTGD